MMGPIEGPCDDRRMVVFTAQFVLLGNGCLSENLASFQRLPDFSWKTPGKPRAVIPPPDLDYRARYLNNRPPDWGFFFLTHVGQIGTHVPARCFVSRHQRKWQGGQPKQGAHVLTPTPLSPCADGQEHHVGADCAASPLWGLRQTAATLEALACQYTLVE